MKITFPISLDPGTYNVEMCPKIKEYFNTYKQYIHDTDVVVQLLEDQTIEVRLHVHEDKGFCLSSYTISDTYKIDDEEFKKHILTHKFDIATKEWIKRKAQQDLQEVMVIMNELFGA
jgi:hypothetical protein